MKFRLPWQKKTPDLSRLGESKFSSLADHKEYELQARIRYISNMFKMILPPFNFTSILGVRCFDDQSLAGGLLARFVAYIDNGGNPPTYHEIYRVLEEVYEGTRKEFIDTTEQHLGRPNPFKDTKRLFFHPSIPTDPVKRAEDNRIRTIIRDMIEAADTFKKYQKYREQLHREFMETEYRIDTHDYPWRKKPPDLSRLPQSKFSPSEASHYELQARIRYISNMLKMILPPFDLTGSLGVRFVDDQTLGRGVINHFAQYVDHGGDPPTYEQVCKAFEDVYQQTKTEFVGDLNCINDPRKLFFDDQIPADPARQEQYERIKAIIVKIIGESLTFSQYRDRRAQLYRDVMKRDYTIDTHQY